MENKNLMNQNLQDCNERWSEVKGKNDTIAYNTTTDEDIDEMELNTNINLIVVQNLLNTVQMILQS